MPDRRTVDELSIEELEQILRVRKMQARQERLRRLEEEGRRQPGAPITDEFSVKLPEERPAIEHESFIHDRQGNRREGKLRDRLLTGIEIIGAIGIVAVLVFAATQLRELNADAATEQAEAVSVVDLPTPTVTPAISVVVLPGGHTPPTAGQDAQPNFAEVPAHLRTQVQQQFFPPVMVEPTPSPSNAVRIRIPSLGVDAPIVQGDGWEQLKKGVGQHIGTANPGESSNMVLSAHNDIYGEIFRYLDRLGPGDEIIISTLTQEFTYTFSHQRVVEPTEVSVMAPTREPIVTLISCYPYLVNSQRIVVVGELAEN